MAQREVIIDGKSYPCRETMGAALRFKREFGIEFTVIQREVAEKGVDHTTELCAWLWCCCASSCKHDGIAFPYSLEDFLDALAPEDLVAALGAESGSEGAGAADSAQNPPKKAKPL